MPSKGIDAAVDAKTVTVTKRSPIERFKDILALEASEDSRDTSDYIQSILINMIEAETLEDSIKAQNAGSASGKDLIDVELEIQWFSFVKSSSKYKTELGHYILVEKAIRLDTLEPIAFSTGAANVIINLWKARDTGRLPLQCVIRGRDTENGTLLSLEILKPRPITVPAPATAEEKPGF